MACIGRLCGSEELEREPFPFVIRCLWILKCWEPQPRSAFRLTGLCHGLRNGLYWQWNREWGGGEKGARELELPSDLPSQYPSVPFTTLRIVWLLALAKKG
jgi:hypothetical protein